MESIRLGRIPSLAGSRRVVETFLEQSNLCSCCRERVGGGGWRNEGPCRRPLKPAHPLYSAINIRRQLYFVSHPHITQTLVSSGRTTPNGQAPHRGSNDRKLICRTRCATWMLLAAQRLGIARTCGTDSFDFDNRLIRLSSLSV